MYGLTRHVPRVFKEQTVVPLPDTYDLFAEKTKKRIGLDNLLNSDAYHEKESFRFNLKWINSAKNFKKLQSMGDKRSPLVDQYIIQKDTISI